MHGNTQLLRRKQVQALTGLARSTIYEKMAAGQFPQPVRIGIRSVAWVAAEIDGWIASRISESRQASIGKVQP
jgi:prophage regulatory protein